MNKYKFWYNFTNPDTKTTIEGSIIVEAKNKLKAIKLFNSRAFSNYRNIISIEKI